MQKTSNKPVLYEIYSDEEDDDDDDLHSLPETSNNYGNNINNSTSTTIVSSPIKVTYFQNFIDPKEIQSIIINVSQLYLSNHIYVSDNELKIYNTIEVTNDKINVCIQPQSNSNYTFHSNHIRGIT